MACRRRHDPCRLVAHRCPDLTVEVRIYAESRRGSLGKQPSCRGEIALHLRSPGRFDLRKSRQATTSSGAGADPARRTSWTSVFNKFRQQIPSLYRIPSESGCPELPRGESCCTGLPGCTGVSCGPGSLNCGVIGFGTSAGTPLSPPRAGCGVDPPDRGAAHAGWVSRNTTARKV